MAKNTSLEALIVIVVSILLTHPSTCQFINSTSTSLSNSITPSILNLLDFSVNAISDVFTTINQVVTYLDLPVAIFYLLILCGSLGILVGVKYGTKNISNIVFKILCWSIYALPQWIVLGIAVGVEISVILFINLTLIIPLASLQWLRDQQAVIRWKVRFMGFQVRALLSDLFESMFGGVIGQTLIAIVDGVCDVLYLWKRQGYCGMLQIFVLIPGMVLAMFVNMVMYFVFFLPVARLVIIWDFFISESTRSTNKDFSDYCDAGMGEENGIHRTSLCMSEAISDLDLDSGEEENETETDSETCINLEGGEKTASLLYPHKSV